MVRNHEEVDREAALKDAQRILDRWRFAASANGMLWIQPNVGRLEPIELSSFLSHLRRGCGSTTPRVVLFDFTESEIAGAEWTEVEKLLLDFAQSIGARCRVTSTVKRPVATILMYRKDASLTATTANHLLN